MFFRFIRATNGNLAITFALSIVPIVFALGAAADYGFAAKTRIRMAAAADAAALAAVTPQNMSQTTSAATQAATQLFNSQVAGLPRLVYNSGNVSSTCVNGTNGWRPPSGTNLCVQVTDQTVNSQRVRKALVAFNAASQTAFGGILNFTQIPIGGTSTATASTSPNIDFYLLLDTSPSMAIPSTQDGINQMVALTPYQSNGGGCAFACHETSPAVESGSASYKSPIFGNPGCPDDPQRRAPPCLDNYQLAVNAGIPLRIQLVNQAVQNLVNTAQATAASTGAAYQLAGYTFDVGFANPIPLQLPTSATIALAATGINMLTVPYENATNGDMNTIFDSSTSTTTGAFPQINAAMNGAYNGAGAGSGTNNLGDHPQQVLMLVTDGVSDELFGGSRIYNPIGGATNVNQQINTWCQKITATANVRIAVLYLVYNPLPMTDGKGNASWYAGHVYPVQNAIAPTLKSCASAGLFYQVNTGGDISAAMNSLFQSAVSSARLSN